MLGRSLCLGGRGVRCRQYNHQYYTGFPADLPSSIRAQVYLLEFVQQRDLLGAPPSTIALILPCGIGLPSRLVRWAEVLLRREPVDVALSPVVT